jgi:hypothetical protein
MKLTVTVVIFTMISLCLGAQTNNSLVYSNAIAKYRTMETAGTFLTIAGGVTFFTGNYLYWKAYNHRDIEEPSAAKVRNSRNIIFGGLGLMAVGIPVWSIARKNERHITISASLVRFNGYATANGAGINIRF